MRPTTTKSMMAAMTRPMLMRASPMSNPMSLKSGLPKMAAMIGLMTPSSSAVDDRLHVEGEDEADGNGEEVALVQELLELLPQALLRRCLLCHVSMPPRGQVSLVRATELSPPPPPASTSTRASLKHAPPAKSLTVSGTSALAVSPPGTCRRHSPFGMRPRPLAAAPRSTRHGTTSDA